MVRRATITIAYCSSPVKNQGAPSPQRFANENRGFAPRGSYREAASSMICVQSEVVKPVLYLNMEPAELKKARRRLGLSQEKLAKELHVNRMSVLRWEAGTRRIPFMLELALEMLEQKLRVLMPIRAQWWSFVESLIEVDRDDPGVYELGDKDGAVIYIGSSNELRQRLKEHLNEAPYTCIRQKATHYRIEYTTNYTNRERELYKLHVATYGKPPRCNDSRKAHGDWS
jgi:DNA-binding transcriptional regulator YiaG